MSGSTTAVERLLEVSNKLWDAMYESGEVPTYAERAHYYLALKDAMDENVKLREYAKLMHDHIKECCDACGERSICDVDALTHSLGIEVD